MSRHATDKAVQRTLDLPVSVDRAFAVFTEEMGRWWPVEKTFAHVALGQPVSFGTVIVEPRAGGRWFELTTEGEEIDRGRVLAYEPPRRLVLTWQVTPNGQPDPDPSKASEVEIRFVSEGPTATRIELEHSGFERHRPDGAAVWRKAMESSDGWDTILDRFAIATTPDGT